MERRDIRGKDTRKSRDIWGQTPRESRDIRREGTRKSRDIWGQDTKGKRIYGVKYPYINLVPRAPVSFGQHQLTKRHENEIVHTSD